MRDPAVQALYALHVTTDEVHQILAGQPIYRTTWPPQRCQGAVVGLCADGRVIGEAKLVHVVSAPAIALGFWFMNGGRPQPRTECRFEPVTQYRTPLPHTHGRGMSSPMPEAPMGTLTEGRVEMW